MRYPDLFTLMDHLQGMGENNAVRLRPNAVSRDVFLAAAATYEVSPAPAADSICTCPPVSIAHAHSLLVLFSALPQSLYADDDGLLPATFQVFYMIGWSPHVSQPKPLERGSATTKMADLGKIASAAATPATKTGCSKDSDAGASFVERDSSS